MVLTTLFNGLAILSGVRYPDFRQTLVRVCGGFLSGDASNPHAGLARALFDREAVRFGFDRRIVYQEARRFDGVSSEPRYWDLVSASF